MTRMHLVPSAVLATLLVGLGSLSPAPAAEAAPDARESRAASITSASEEPVSRVDDAIDETGRATASPMGATSPGEARAPAPSFTTDPAWDLLQQLSLWKRLKVGTRVAVQFDLSAQSLLEIAPADTLTANSRQAVNRAPTWLQKPLEDLFERLTAANQDRYAAPILSAVDPFVDEIAFEVAHLSPNDLNNASFNVQLLNENVQQIYTTAADVQYAEILDYGSSSTGGDYYSTIRYRVDEGGTIQTYDLPRDVYYWFVVHPRGSDELPTYINPSAPCSSAGTPAAPPTGKFWRSWLYNGGTNESGGMCGSVACPILRDQLSGIQVLWGSSSETGAVGVLSNWVRQSMEAFGDRDGCRPVEPVTIYYYRDGACGEWGDLTMAAARAALVPTIVIDAAPNDHCWNEFYERGWHQWEPVNGMVDAFTAYDSWWAGKGGMASSHSWRGDGFGWTGETAAYTPSATLTVTVYDTNHYPVDAAKVELYSEYDALPIVVQRISQGATNDQGQITFTLGDNRNFYVKITSPWGTVYPASGTSKVVTAAVAGTQYNWSPPNFAGAVPRLAVTTATPPGSPTDDYLLEVSYDVGEEYVHGNGYSTSIQYTKDYYPGNLDSFIVNGANWSLFESGAAFQAYTPALDSTSRRVSFVVPAADDHYVAWSNKAAMDMAQVLSGTVTLYHNNGTVPPVTALGVGKDAAFDSLLDWEDVVGQNVDGYVVYRSTSASDVGGARNQSELAPFQVATPTVSQYTDTAQTPQGSCFFYSIRTHSRRGGISP